MWANIRGPISSPKTARGCGQTLLGTLSGNTSRSMASCIACLDLVTVHCELWHFEFFPTPFLLVRWNVLDVRGNPPNIAAGVFDAAITLTGRQRHDRKNRNSARAERAIINRVAIRHIQVNRGGHRPKLWDWVGQHEHRISNLHRSVHDCAIWPLLLEN